MQRFSKYTLPLVAILVSTFSISNSVFAQPSRETQEIIGEYERTMQDMQKVAAMAQRQNALRGPCNNGNQRACAEIRQIDQEITRMINRSQMR